jgi:peroxiredoxin-like protein
MEKHVFVLAGTWKGGLNGIGHITAGQLQLQVSAPVELAGAGLGTNPEELLLSAAATCYMITLGAILEKRSFPIRSLELHSEATYSQIGSLKCESIVHRPMIQLDAGAGEEHKEAARLAAMRAEKACMVTKALSGNVDVRVEPVITGA